MQKAKDNAAATSLEIDVSILQLGYTAHQINTRYIDDTVRRYHV